MTPVRTVVLDNEAVQALLDVGHPKNRRALAVIEAVASRNERRAGTVRLVVPTSVRVEAGWVRRAPRAAAINRLRFDDLVLDAETADTAARIRAALPLSVADAHLAATLGGMPGPHAVVTSDAGDTAAIARHLGLPLRTLVI